MGSAFSAPDVTAGSRTLASPRVCVRVCITYSWRSRADCVPASVREAFASLESRPNGTNGIVEIAGDGTRHVLPEPHSASTIVYEYGGLPYAVLSGDQLRIVFSNSKGKRLGCWT